MKRFWSEQIRGLDPYVPGEQPGERKVIKLNTNENPYPPSPAVIEALRAACDDKLRLYPDPEAHALSDAIARANGLTREQVFIGNGSDEVLAHTFLGLLKHARPVLVPDISYSFYPIYCALYGIDYEHVPLSDDFSVDVAAYRRPNGGIVLPNPNAPTGLALDRDGLRALLEASPEAVVVVDEAYVDFGAESAVPLIQAFPNLLVIQTVSKSRSLAGLRVGYALGDTNLIQALETVKGCFNSYPLDRLAQVGALAALEDTAYYQETTRRIVASREALAAELSALDFEVVPSSANFLFVRHRQQSGGALYEALRERGVLVRHFDKPRIADHLRITVGTPDECAALINALRAIIGSSAVSAGTSCNAH